VDRGGPAGVPADNLGWRHWEVGGFYSMANAGGRLLGTVLSGALFLVGGLQACLRSSSVLVGLAALVSARLTTPPWHNKPNPWPPESERNVNETYQ
jgi:hypothetical protein